MLKKSNGDSGKTSLLKKNNLTKTNLIFSLLGDLDELNCFLGVAKIEVGDKKIKEWLQEIQKDIFSLSSSLAGGGEIDWEEMISAIDKKCFICQNNLPAIKKFIIPGSSCQGAWVDVARSVCRRAERTAWLMKQKRSQETAIYLNHLSKFLFFLARWTERKNSIKSKERFSPRSSTDRTRTS